MNQEEDRQEGYSRTVRIAVAVLSVLVLVEAFMLFAVHRVTCSATRERLGRIDLYRSIIKAEERNPFISDEFREMRIEPYRRQIVLVQDTISAADLYCDPQAARYMLNVPRP